MSSDDKSVDCSVNDVAAVPSIPPLTRRQKIIFFAVGTCYLFDMMSFSILAPFFPIEVSQKRKKKKKNVIKKVLAFPTFP